MARFPIQRVAVGGAKALSSTAFRLLWLCGVASAAHAQQFTVGADPDCSTTTIQAAINAADDGYAIHIARSATYTAQALVINGKDLHLIGGYANCSSVAPSGATTLSGLGGAQDSVLTIRGASNVKLENLSLIRGDEVYDGYGGGIDFKGMGSLRLLNAAVTQNYAGYGGGISVIGEGGSVAFDMDTGSVVQLNTAQFSGGGIRIEGDVRMNMVKPDSIILSNQALGLNPSNNTAIYGNGGGLQVLAPAQANIGSPGLGISGPIVNNTARYGGGIAVDGLESGGQRSDALVRVFTTDPNKPTRIHGNRATQTGGGIHLLPDYSGFFSSIFSGAIVCVWDARIEDNKAQQGAALYADTDFGTAADVGSDVYFNRNDGASACPGRPTALGAVACAAGVPCNTIDGNLAENESGVATSGATVLMQNQAYFSLVGMKLRRNRGGSLIRVIEPHGAEFANLLATDNILSAPVVRVEGGVILHPLRDSTITGNTLTSSQVLSISGDLLLERSIIWQPGTTALSIGGTLSIADVIAHEVGSLGDGPEAIAAPPRFLDPAHGDYGLQAASAAVDFAPVVSGDDRDLDGVPRDVDLPVKINFRGSRDIGALERQTVGNLVLNPAFPPRSDSPADELRLWSTSSPATTTWINTEGAPGSVGSVYVTYTPPLGRPTATPEGPIAYVGLRQCVNIPGSGVYALSGWSRVPGNGVNRDYARLHWIFRSNDAACAGTPTAEGNLFLARSGTWSLGPGAEIPIAPGAFTGNSTIEIVLEVLDGDTIGTNAIDAYFDEIALRSIALDVPGIFKDGFE